MAYRRSSSRRTTRSRGTNSRSRSGYGRRTAARPMRRARRVSSRASSRGRKMTQQTIKIVVEQAAQQAVANPFAGTVETSLGKSRF